MKNINGQTLEQLENDDWGDPPYPSHLVTECHRLRRVPLGEFTTENLRIMIGQNIGLKYLLPLALDVLRQNPIATGDYYEGDLLLSVIRCDAVKNDQDTRLRNELHTICRSALSELPRIVKDDHFSWHGSRNPEEFRIDAEKFESLIEAEVAKCSMDMPWRAFRAFTAS